MKNIPIPKLKKLSSKNFSYEGSLSNATTKSSATSRNPPRSTKNVCGYKTRKSLVSSKNVSAENNDKFYTTQRTTYHKNIFSKSAKSKKEKKAAYSSRNFSKILKSINDLNEIIDNPNIIKYILNKTDQVDGDILTSMIKNLVERYSKIYNEFNDTSFVQTSSKTVNIYKTSEVKEESLKRINVYKKCFVICFKALKELTSKKEIEKIIDSQEKSVNNLVETASQKGSSKSKSKSKSKTKQKSKPKDEVKKNLKTVSADRTVLSGNLSEANEPRQSTNQYKFEVSKPKNGEIILTTETDLLHQDTEKNLNETKKAFNNFKRAKAALLKSKNKIDNKAIENVLSSFSQSDSSIVIISDTFSNG